MRAFSRAAARFSLLPVPRSVISGWRFVSTEKGGEPDDDALLAKIARLERENSDLARSNSVLTRDLAIVSSTTSILRSRAEALTLDAASGLEQCSADELLCCLPSVPEATIQRCHEALFAARPAIPSLAANSEKPAMHDFMTALLRCARPAESEQVLHHEKKATIKGKSAGVIPDIVSAHMRDSSFTMHTLLFGIELKKREPSQVLIGNIDALDYATRHAEYQHKLFLEAGLEKVAQAVTAFSNGERISFKRVVFSRIVGDGSKPVLKQTTADLELLPAALMASGQWPADTEVRPPPCEGFRALVRVLSATAEQLGEFSSMPDSVAIPLDASWQPATYALALGQRVGMGGYCDVYEAHLDATSAAALPGTLVGDSVAVKIPRMTSLKIRRLQLDEATCLRDLQSGGAVCESIPRLVSTPPPHGCSGVDMAAAGWDVEEANAGGHFPAGLLLAPLGRPVLSVLAELQGEEDDAASKRFLRARFAKHVCAGVRHALVHAHARGYLHMDVRPSNIVLVKGTAPDWTDSTVVLVDWALRSKIGSRHAGLRGVADYVHDEINLHSHWTALPKYDAIGLAYTYATLAFGHVSGGVAFPPWDGHRRGTSFVVDIIARHAWVAGKGRERASISAFIAAAEAATTGPALLSGLPAL